MFTVKIITAYPEMFPGVLGHSIFGKALEDKKWNLKVINLRKFGYNQRKNIDDTPFGGGPGMIIRPDVVEKALIEAFIDASDNKMLIYMTPAGKPLIQNDLIKISKIEEIIILCGRFEGVDHRAIDILGFHQISLGDYILAGGEVAAQVLVEGCIRLLPGVLGQPESVLEESFSSDFLEYPQYTKPKVWKDAQNKDHHVPEILFSGNHEKIKDWRKQKSIEITKKYRPELLKEKK